MGHADAARQPLAAVPVTMLMRVGDGAGGGGQVGVAVISSSHVFTVALL